MTSDRQRGLVALTKFDLVAWIFGLDFGDTNALTRIVYGLVGLSAIYLIAALAGSRSASGPLGSASSGA